MFLFNPLYLLFVAPALIFMLYAQSKVSSTYSKYSKVANMHSVSGAEVARTLLETNGLYNVNIERTGGRLTDHYDPRSKTLRLSEGVFGSRSVAALGIVAHEVGHAVQDQQGYAFMRVRAGLVPIANLGSSLAPILFIIGLITQLAGLMWLGVFLFAGALLFTLVTLPVEYNASSRARRMLQTSGLVIGQEYNAASAVLSAAALTYVAALLQALANFLYFVFMAMGASRRD